MKKLMAVVFFAGVSLSAQVRDVGATEQATRLVQGKMEYQSPFCPDKGVVVSIRLTIDRRGQVVRADDNKVSRLPKPAKKAVEAVKRFVLLWRFRPLLVDGQPVQVRTFARVNCYGPPSQ
jgi:hypothetical protein